MDGWDASVVRMVTHHPHPLFTILTKEPINAFVIYKTTRKLCWFSSVACLMHVSFASQSPGYQGTSGDCGQTRSLEADKSPLIFANLHTGQGIFNAESPTKSRPLYHGRTRTRSQLKFLAQMITIKPRLQPCTCSPLAGRSACTNPLHYHDECPAIIAQVPGGWGYKW